MADTLVERLTGQAAATEVGVDVRVVITDRSLVIGDHEPALLEGYGTVPATWPRDLIADAVEGLRAWFHRLYTAPGTGDPRSPRLTITHRTGRARLVHPHP